MGNGSNQAAPTFRSGGKVEGQPESDERQQSESSGAIMDVDMKLAQQAAERRQANSSCQPSLDVRAIDRVLIEQAKERLEKQARKKAASMKSIKQAQLYSITTRRQGAVMDKDQNIAIAVSNGGVMEPIEISRAHYALLEQEAKRLGMSLSAALARIIYRAADGINFRYAD